MFFGVCGFFQKMNERNCFTTTTTCFRSFFGRIRRHQKTFRNYLTFRTTLKLSYFFTCQVEFGFALSLYLVIYALDSGARWSVLDKNNVANNNNRTQDRDSQSVIQSGDILAPEKLLLGLDLPINFHHE